MMCRVKGHFVPLIWLSPLTFYAATVPCLKLGNSISVFFHTVRRRWKKQEDDWL